MSGGNGAEYVLVPKSELEELEQARVRLVRKVYEGTLSAGDLHSGITDVMWRIANRKYPAGGPVGIGGAPR